MALVAVAADKGGPGVTTASLALAAVWPRPVLLAECDAAGGDLLYRLPAADGGRLDPQRGLLSLAVAARRGIQPPQVWRHTQKLPGGLDILTGLVNAEQRGRLHLLWGQIGKGPAEGPKGETMLRGHWGPRLDRSLLIRTARELAGHLARELPMLAGQTATGPGQYSPESSKAEQAAELAQPEPWPSGPGRPGPW